MGIVTTHTEGRVVTHASDGALPVDVVQLPERDGVGTSAVATPSDSPAAPVGPVTPATAAAPVKTATKQQAARVKKAPKAPKAAAPAKRKT